MSDQPENVDLAYIGRSLARLTTEVSSMRDDMGVMTAILQRLDGTVSGLVNEIRATHSQFGRMDRRMRELEGKQQ